MFQDCIFGEIIKCSNYNSCKTMADFVKKLLDNNKKWVESKLGTDPEYFARLNSRHEPKVLWIGCSDARVPANEITGTLPGDVFVHRNICQYGGPFGYEYAQCFILCH